MDRNDCNRGLRNNDGRRVIRIHVIYRFGIPKTIIVDNGQPIRQVSYKMESFLTVLQVGQRTNRGVHKTLCIELENSGQEQEDAGKTSQGFTIRTVMQATPYSLVFGREAIFTLEI